MSQLELLRSYASNNFPGWRITDMQFNIGRLEGHTPRGIDLINPQDQSRVLVTEKTEPEIDAIIKAKLGEAATFEVIGTEGEIDVHAVPDGTQLLAKVLRQSPYERKYMESLARRGGRFLGLIRDISPVVSGVDLNNIAVVPGSMDQVGDDAVLAFVPPYEVGSGEELTRDAVIRASLGIVPDDLRASFIQGLSEV